MLRSNFELFPKKFGYSPYVWIIYLLLPIFLMISERGMRAVIGFMLIGFFAVSYRQLFVVKEPAFSYWLILQMTVIVILCVFYNPNHVFMGFFSANFIGQYHKKRSFAISMIGLLIVVAIPILQYHDVFDLRDYFMLIPFMLIMLSTPFGMRSMNSRRHLQNELDQANEQIKEMVKREERVRISRDLHDTLGHTLSLITLKSQLVQRLVAKDQERAIHEAVEIERTSRAALRQVRELVSDMRMSTVENGLQEISKLLDSAGILLHTKGDFQLQGVPDLTQSILSMCLIEAINNVVKHSGAATCIITLEQTRAQIKLTVQDDGEGFIEEIAAVRGNGLKGMSERLSLIEGSLTLSSSEGAMLCITIPVVLKNTEVEALA